MTTYMEFNRDLFLCNTLQKDTDSQFSSLLFENTKGKSVITYNNLQNAMFYFIPKNTNTNPNWSSLPPTNANVKNVLSTLNQSGDICNNTPPYIISSRLYFDLNKNAFTYDKFLTERNKYPTTTHIYAYTFGKLQVFDISSIDPVKDIQFTTTISENFQSYFYPVIENFRKSSKPKPKPKPKPKSKPKPKPFKKPNFLPAVKNLGKNIGNAVQNNKPNVLAAVQNKNNTIVKQITGTNGISQIEVIPPTKHISAVAQSGIVAAANNIVQDKVNNASNMVTNQLKACKQGDTIKQCLSKLPLFLSRIISSSIEPFYIKEGNTSNIDVKNETTAVINGAIGTAKQPQKYYSPKDLRIYQLSDTLYPVMDINCANYSINSVCSIDDSTTNCEICKNFAYRDWYDANNNNNIKSFANHDDRKQEYFRTWIQTCNLGIGILLLSIGVYYQSN